MAILLLAEHTNGALNPATGKALSAAAALGDTIDVLVAGSGAKPAAEAAAKLDGHRQGFARRCASVRAWARRGGGGAHRAADGQLRCARRAGDVVGQEHRPACRRCARRDADLRYHQGSVEGHLRAADLRRQRHPDRAVVGRQEGHHGAHRGVSVRTRGRIGGGRDHCRARSRRAFKLLEGGTHDLGPARACFRAHHRVRRPRPAVG